MSLPKRQHSKQRQSKRRANWKVRVPGMGSCPQCKKPILSHRVCPFCGFYKGKQIVLIKQKEDKNKKQQ